ncbi:SAM-dependent DNA methyltransferase [Demequina sp. SYSU T00039]|uniref:site-specific DNA-methyltransferase (adenine-specific) n=1 Tax=Demequina lignilytica TaxID=3051663 RepID=A0AAW7M7D1_9MICO|nr:MULTISPECIES: DNA methyltransferase [unclassified Demequina]MDN4477300.1 SAM-dependent DNA methyltransferase [Demequina sp. SYSU T00039-1]MDN4487473.1 SAM-dependent DNA methyltransferase [Demequina sp. SYSU T00039]
MAVDPWEWLSLIDSDGPFLSKAALKSFHPSGLPKPDAGTDGVNATFVDEFTRWTAAWSSGSDDYAAARDRWVEAVFRTLLDWSDDLTLAPVGLSAESPNGAATVRPWAALAGENGPAALVTIVDRTENLRSTGTDGWSANAIDRMAVLLRATGVSIGIVTDGRWWALVSATKEATAASGVWDALLWREERPSRDAFLALASYASIAGGAPEKRLPLLFEKSVASAEEITEALGDQVRRAVELVLQSMSDTHLRALAQGDPSPLPEDPKAAYEGAVTVLMRIVFLLFAEERGLLPEHELYRSSYSISTVREALQREATSTSVEALDHSWETWHRLLAASNAVFGGASFQDMRMPAYGGSLFDPARFPWLQATDARGQLRVRLTDRAMLAVLRAVQTIEDGAMQLSFRDLDVEQIGYVYEGLLGYSAAYVPEVTVGLQGKAGFEPEIALAELEEIAAEAAAPADFAKSLVAHLKKTQEQSKPKTANQIAKGFAADDAEAAADARTRLRHALLGDDELAGRLQPFHGLIRSDLRGFPYVVPAGGLVMTESPQRANTGTHYTPRSLAEEVVLHALQPLVYAPGPLDTENSSKWKLKSSAEILDLKIADIAAGSGAFLVAAARYLADRLIEARANEGLDVTGESDLKRWAVREVVARCLYGADINGMAVEMCKLSLWLISMDPGKPFSFVDDRVFHGNSLLGVTTEAQLRAQHIYPERRRQGSILQLDVDKELDNAARIRRELASGQVDDADRMRSTKAKQALLAQAELVTAKLRDVADGIIAAGLLEGGKRGTKLDDRYVVLADALRAAYPSDDGAAPDRTKLDAIIDRGLTPTVDTGESRWKPLHWILEAPDVIHTHGGFDAIIGNPPFLGGTKISAATGTAVRDWLANTIARDRSGGRTDLVAYFFLRSSDLLTTRGALGLVATNTIAQGDTREVGLDRLEADGFVIYRAIRSRPWPSANATLDYSAVWSTRALIGSDARFSVDGEPARRISTLLEAAGRNAGMPLTLSANSNVAFEGGKPLGKGFILAEQDAVDMIQRDSRNRAVLRPFLTGDDLTSRPDRQPSRWIVDFNDRDIIQAAAFREPFELVTRLVKPERQRTGPGGSYVLRSPLPDRWWQHAEKRPGLRAATADLGEALAIARVSKAIMPVRISTEALASEALVVFASASYALQAILSSTAHISWCVRYASTMGASTRYTPSDVFGTFPIPAETPTLCEVGNELDQVRSAVMNERRIGLTDLYNLVNSPNVEGDLDVDRLRDIHSRIDRAVMDAYGWADLHLEHGFSNYRQFEGWSVNNSTRLEILDRLLEENHRRAKLEAESAPSTKAKRGKSLSDTAKPEGAMF